MIELLLSEPPLVFAPLLDSVQAVAAGGGGSSPLYCLLAHHLAEQEGGHVTGTL